MAKNPPKLYEHDLICECCGVERGLGVASTIIPYSAAFGINCLRMNTQPRWIVDALLEENGGLQGCNSWFKDLVTVYVRRRRTYMTVREYVKQQKLHGRL